MGKINKYANIYDTEGNLLRHVGEDGKLKNYTTEELEQLLDKLSEDKDEDGNVKDPKALNNVYRVLGEEYRKHPDYVIKKLSEANKLKTDSQEVTEALEDTNEAINISSQSPMKTLSEEEQKALYDDMKQIALTERETDYEPDTYIQFEEITDNGQRIDKEFSDVGASAA